MAARLDARMDAHMCARHTACVQACIDMCIDMCGPAIDVHDVLSAEGARASERHRLMPSSFFEECGHY